ncbi:TonB-dependent receptor [Sphingomonas sp. 37zxx]|uniref:TonB-dependent receptor n=1 Tax=Sphingomonas sp. 37zxx TaxID=1550073 RepID=UPI000690451E|nr:TonB-dependent receptor [Sphingomonas sp. 37zxx]
MKVGPLCGASWAAFFAIVPAAAQTVLDDDLPADDIIVTAQLERQTLQSVPIAVTAITAEQLERSGINDLRTLEALSASFNLTSANSQSSGTTIRIRGVGTTGNNTGLESAVGIFIDGVYLSRSGIALGDLLDVQQVEILRGPQGTLFGRNTSAGALNITTAAPNLARVEGFASTTGGNYELFNVQAGMSVPIVRDTLGVRLSGAYRERDGYIGSTAGPTSGDRNRYVVRGQLLWQPNDDLSFRLVGDYAKSDEHCCEPIIVQDTSFVRRGLYTQVGLPADGGVPISGQAAIDARLGNSEDQRDRLEQWGTTGQLDWRLGDIKLTAITAYRWSDNTPVANSDFTSLKVLSTSDTGATATGAAQQVSSRITTFSQEIRLSGAVWEDRLKLLVGAYYLDETIDELQSLTLGSDYQRYNSVLLRAIGITALGPNPALVLAQNVNATGDFANNLFTQKGRNWSIFTNETLKLTDRVAVNVGLRYSNDRKEGVFSQLSARSSACGATLTSPIGAALPAAARNAAISLACFPFATRANLAGAGTASGPPTPVTYDLVFQDDSLNYTAKLIWTISEAVNSYASFTHGYKSGGFNLDPSAGIAGADPRFDSETVDAYEIGLKLRLGRSFTANFALFDARLFGLQVLEFTGIQFTTFNVPKARSTGGEIELMARVSPRLTVNGSYTYTNARFPSDCAGALTAVNVTSLCGQSLINAPRHAVITGFDHRQPIGRNLTIGFSGSARLESDRRTSTQAVIVGTSIPAAFDIQDSNVKLDMRAGLGRADGLWRVELWGNNLTDAFTRSITFNMALRGTPGAAGGPGGIGQARGGNYAEPRTYGLTVRRQF